MTRSNIVSDAVLPPIIVSADEAQRLCALANSNWGSFHERQSSWRAK